MLLLGVLAACGACSAGDPPFTLVLGSAGHPVTLQATLAPPDGVSLRWELVAQPANSTALSPASTTATAVVTVDQPGVYLFDILVDNGLTTNVEEQIELDATGSP